MIGIAKIQLVPVGVVLQSAAAHRAARAGVGQARTAGSGRFFLGPCAPRSEPVTSVATHRSRLVSLAARPDELTGGDLIARAVLPRNKKGRNRGKRKRNGKDGD